MKFSKLKGCLLYTSLHRASQFWNIFIDKISFSLFRILGYEVFQTPVKLISLFPSVPFVIHCFILLTSSLIERFFLKPSWSSGIRFFIFLVLVLISLIDVSQNGWLSLEVWVALYVVLYYLTVFNSLPGFGVAIFSAVFHAFETYFVRNCAAFIVYVTLTIVLKVKVSTLLFFTSVHINVDVMMDTHVCFNHCTLCVFNKIQSWLRKVVTKIGFY